MKNKDLIIMVVLDIVFIIWVLILWYYIIHNEAYVQYCKWYAQALNYDKSRIVWDLCVVPDLEHPWMDLPLFKFNR